MKLHLPTGLRSALFACFAAVASLGATLATATVAGGVFAVSVASVAQAGLTTQTTAVSQNAAGTVAAGTTYSGIIMTLDTTSKLTDNDSGVYWYDYATANSKLIQFTADGTNGTEAVANQSSALFDNKVTWNAFCDYNGAPYGNVLRFSADYAPANATSVAVSGKYGPWVLGGLIVEESDIKWTTGRNSVNTTDNSHKTGNSVTRIKANGKANFTIGADMTLCSAGNGNNIEVQSGGDWAVAGGKTLAFDAYNGSIVVYENQTIDVKKLTVGVTTSSAGGKVLFVDNVKFEAGSTLNVGAGTIVEASAAADLLGTVTVAKDGQLILNGVTTLNSAIANSGTVILGENAKLDISALEEVDNTYTLFTGGGKLEGLTAENLATKVIGLELAGRNWSVNDDGTLSYVLTVKDMTWDGSSPLVWNVGTTMTTGGDFAQDDMVTFTGDSDVTLGAAISSEKVTIAEDKTVSLSNGGVEGNVLDASSILVNGSLVLEDAALAENARVSGESTGTVIVSGEQGAKLNFTAQLQDFNGDVRIEGGRFSLTASRPTPFSSITVVDGGQLELSDMATAYSGDITIAGNGTSDETYLDSAFRTKNITVSGKLTVADGGASIGIWGAGNDIETLTVSGELAGSGTLTKKEGGRILLTGNVSHSGELKVEGGRVVLGNDDNGAGGANMTNKMNFSSVEVADGAKFTFAHASADFSETGFVLNGGATLEMFDSNVTNTVDGVVDPYNNAISVGTVKLQGNANLRYIWKGVFNLTDLTGEGNLTIVGDTAGNDPRATIISGIRNYKGVISGDIDKHDIYIGAVHQDSGFDAVIKDVLGGSAGIYTSIQLKDFAKTGEGNLVIVGDVAVSDQLTMNFGGGLYFAEDMAETSKGLNIVSVEDGMILNYTKDAGLLSLSAEAIGEAKLALNLMEVKDLLAGDGIDLGIASSVSTDKLSLVGISGGVFEAKDGNWWYKGGQVDTQWDPNWEASVLLVSPKTLPEVTAMESSIVLSQSATYTKDGVSSILISGTKDGATGLVVMGGGSTADNVALSAVTTETWIRQTGGTLSAIVGGNYANNWLSNGRADFTGDSHIYVTGGSVGIIVGGNCKDAHAPTFRGSSYISVASDSVVGSVYGASLGAHHENITFIGDTHIAIYVPQTASENVAPEQGWPQCMIAGGHSVLNHSGSTLTLTGNSEILMDFYLYEDEAPATMGKVIIGGSYAAQHNSVQTGNTSITIRNADKAVFSKMVIGGASEGNSTIDGSTQVTIESGTFNDMVMAGSYGGSSNITHDTELKISGGTFKHNVIGGSLCGTTGKTYSSTITGTSTVNISGGTFENLVIGGSYDNTGSTTLNVGAVEMVLSGGTFSQKVIGGNHDTGNDQAVNPWDIGNISIAVSGTAELNSDLYGGSNATRNAAGHVYTQGQIKIDLQGGTLKGNVYAAGSQSGSSQIMTESTTVNLSSAVVLGSGGDSNIYVSGGYAGTGTGSTVTDGRTLNFTSGATYNNLANTTFKDFDKVSVVNGGSATAAFELAAGATLTKVGAGTLNISSAHDGVSLVASEGTLALSSADSPSTLSALTMSGEDTVVDLTATEVTLDGLLGIVGGTIKLAEKSLTLGEQGSLFASDAFTLDLGLDSLPSEFRVTVLSGVKDEATQLSQLTFAEDADTGLKIAQIATGYNIKGLEGDAHFELTDDGKLVLTNASLNAWIWAGDEGNVWKNDSELGWKSDKDTPNGQTVVFNDSGIAQSTVTIEGAVTPASVTVDVSKDNAYTFVSDATTAGSIADAADTKTTLTKKGEGSLTIELANTYSGGTTIEGGTLVAKNATALGTGDVNLTGGTLELQEAIDNKVAFGGGTLDYQTDADVAMNKFSSTAEINVNVGDGKTVVWTSTEGDQLNTAELFGNGMTVEGDGSLQLVFKDYKFIGTSGSTFTVDGNLSIVSNKDGSSMELYSQLSGTGYVVLDSQAGSFNVNGDNSGFAGILEITSADIGTTSALNLANANAAGGASTTLKLNDAVLRLGDGGTIGAGTVELVDGSTSILSRDAATSTTMTGALTGTGTLKVGSGSTLNLSGNVSGFAGELTDNGGAIAIDFGGKDGQAAIAATPDANGNLFADGAKLTASGDSAVNLRFNYSNDSLNMNALVSGAGAKLTYTGTGTLVLTQANTAGGQLTAEKGTVAIDGGTWAGNVSVAAGATLHIKDASTALTNVASSGLVILEDGQSLTSLSGGADLKVAGDATVTTITDGLDELTIDAGKTLTTSAALEVATLVSEGTLDASGQNVTLTGETAKGGTIKAADVSLTGANSFTSLQSSGTVTAAGALTLSEASEVNALTGVTTLTTNGATTVNTGDVSLEQLAGTGSLTVTAGGLTLTGTTPESGVQSSLDGDLSVAGGALSIAGSLKVGGTLTTNGTVVVNPTVYIGTPALTMGELGGTTTLTFSTTEDTLADLHLSHGMEYTLAQITGTSVFGTPTLDLGADVVDSSYSLSLSDDGKEVLLVFTVSGNQWTSSDSSWDATSSWSQQVPTESLDALFLGDGSEKVVIGDGAAAQKLLVDAAGKTYTFTDEGAGKTLTLETLEVVNGSMAVEKIAAVEGDAPTPEVPNTLTINVEGEVSVGSATQGAAPVLTLGEGTTLTAGTMTVLANGTVTNGGTLEVAGALTAAESTLTSPGALSVGAGSTIKAIDGQTTGSLAVTGDTTVATLTDVAALDVEAGALTVGTLTGDAIGLTMADGTTAAIGSSVSLSSAKSTGELTLSAGSTLTVTEAAVAAGAQVGSATADAVVVEWPTTQTFADTAATPSVSFVDLTTDSLTVSSAMLQAGQSITLTGTLAPRTADKTAVTLVVDGWEQLDMTAAQDYVVIAGGVSVGGVLLDEAADIQQAFAQAGTYAALVTVDNNAVLRVLEDAPRVWNTSETWAGNPNNNDGKVLDLDGITNWYDKTATIDQVVVDKDTTIDLTGAEHVMPAGDADGMLLSNVGTPDGASYDLTLKGTADDLATLANDQDTLLDGTLTITDMTVDVSAKGGAQLEIAETVLAGADAMLNVDESANYRTGKLNGTTGTLSGKVSILGTGGSYSGNYSNATVNMTAGATQRLAPKAGLTLAGNGGTATLDYAGANASMTAIATTGANVTLLNGGATGNTTTLTLAAPSSMQGGTLAFNVNMGQIAGNLGSANVPVITNGEQLTLKGTQLAITQADSAATYVFDLSNGTTGITLFTISDGAAMDVSSITVTGDAFNRYFTNLRVENGAVVGDIVTDYYGSRLGLTENGEAGLAMLDYAALSQNPQATNPTGDVAKVLDTLDAYVATGNAEAADKLAAAVAGAGVAAVGSAALGDVDRQLRAIRNRMTSMGVDQCVVNEDMPYFNAWINAEGDHREMSADETLSGYTLSSWGGTVGMDIDVCPELTFGLAATAMYGDYTSESADTVEGDLDSYYLTAFARVTHRAWVHSFVATLGKHDLTLSRTVNYGAGSYSTDGDTSGMSFGLLYEVGHTIALDEDATTCWQPVFNVSFRHVGIDGYNESGSDAALSYGDQSLNMVTFGLGARLQTAFGENVYNRTSLFEMRALAKFDAGDRECESDVAFAMGGHTSKVKSAEMGAFGVEVGAGLTIPIGQESGSLFFDASVELRQDYTNVNGTVGYRINF